MTQDEQHLKLISLFHFIVGGITALFSLFPVIHLVIGLALVFAPGKLGAHGEAPPAFVGWIFIVAALFFMTLGWTMAACIAAAGRCLAARKRYMFCLVMAGIECIFMPFGTVLGVFTIVVLTREPVKSLFAAAQGCAVSPEKAGL